MKVKLQSSEFMPPILDDQPAKRDLLDFVSYCRAFSRLILNPGAKTPITFGIYGRWGTGKTTLMRMLEADLRRGKVTTVWFNAWQYSREDELWAAFLQSILNQLHSKFGPFQSILFALSLMHHRTNWKAVPQLILEYLARCVATLLPIVLASSVAQQARSDLAHDLIQIGGGLVASAFGVWILIRPAIDAIRQRTSIDFTAFRKSEDYQKHIAFLDNFREQFSDIVNSIPSRSERRIAIFIDDLDRCSPDRAIQVLDAVQLFIDVPGCVYILGLDVDVIHKAVALKYPGDPVAQREYLGKIIQLPFHLPPLSHDQVKRFVEHVDLLLPDYRCREVFVRGMTMNPREVKRTLNAYSLLWSIATQRQELEGVIKPVRLAKIVAIQHGYPDLHRLLQDKPTLLSTLEDFFRGTDQGDSATDAVSPVASTDTTPDRSEFNRQLARLPAALQPYASSENLRQMLSMRTLAASGEDDANFASLSAEGIGVYFTLARQIQIRTKPFQPLVLGLDIGDRFEVLGKITEGGSTQIFLAKDHRSGNKVVIKTLIPILADDSGNQEGFRRAASLLQSLNHRNIVRVIDSGTYSNGSGADQYYIVEEYLAGGSLQEMIDQNHERRLSVNTTILLLIPVLDGLSYVHRMGMVHLDIKPGNILLDSSGTPKIVDFGISAELQNASRRPGRTGAPFVGTPEYMSPEQATGWKVDSRSDLYSFGCTLYACLAGRPPFDDDTIFGLLYKHVSEPIPDLMKVNREVPLELARILNKLLAKKADDRYATADNVREDMLRVLEKWH